jgi:hypothetical protein
MTNKIDELLNNKERKIESEKEMKKMLEEERIRNAKKFASDYEKTFQTIIQPSMKKIMQTVTNKSGYTFDINATMYRPDLYIAGGDRPSKIMLIPDNYNRRAVQGYYFNLKGITNDMRILFIPEVDKRIVSIRVDFGNGTRGFENSYYPTDLTEKVIEDIFAAGLEKL